MIQAYVEVQLGEMRGRRLHRGALGRGDGRRRLLHRVVLDWDNWGRRLLYGVDVAKPTKTTVYMYISVLS